METPSKTVLEIRRYDLVSSLQQRVNRVNKILKIMRGGTRQLKNTTNSILQLEMTPKKEADKRPSPVNANSPEAKRSRTNSAESGVLETDAPAQEDEKLSEGSVTDASQTETVAANGEQIVEREQTSQPDSAANADSEVSEEGQEAEPEERTETPLSKPCLAASAFIC